MWYIWCHTYDYDHSGCKIFTVILVYCYHMHDTQVAIKDDVMPVHNEYGPQASVVNLTKHFGSNKIEGYIQG